MKKVGGFLSLLISVGLIWLFNGNIQLGDKNIPPLGKLLSPFTGYLQNAEALGEPAMAEKVEIKGLSGEVSVYYDERLVPHIFADNLTDAAKVQGYVAAQHRLWQMEFQTHAAAGRISEIMGRGTDDAYLNFDKNQRRIGLTYGAEQTLKAWEDNPEAMRLLQAYTDGVNAWIYQLKTKDYPVEYKLLNYAPEPWSPLKTALLLKHMSKTLCNRSDDVLHSNTLAMLGDSTYQAMYPDFFDKQSPIILKEDWGFENILNPVEENEADADGLGETEPIIWDALVDISDQTKPGIGSNNWAVSGSKTQSGNPILCNDPHLELNLPSIWYEVQLHTPDANVYGVSLPGAPGIVIGFNGDVAWGVTNVAWDVQDWFKLKFKSVAHEEYLLDGEWKPVQKRVEAFKVRNGGIIQDTVKYTHWGPIVYSSKNHPQSGLAMKWIAHEGTNDVNTFVHLNQAKNYDDYKKALSSYACPAQNFVFASKEGDIALWVNGKLPLKNDNQGKFLLDGSTKESDWKGYIPHEHNPHIKNPEWGFVGSANQHSTYENYPYYYNGYFEEYRGRYLNKALEEMEDIVPKDLMEMQQSTFSFKAADFVPLMLKNVKESDLTNNASALSWLQRLRKWDFKYEKDSKESVLFEMWLTELENRTWQDDFPLRNEKYVWPEQHVLAAMMDTLPFNPFFDYKTTPQIENAEDITTMAFVAALDNMANWEESNNMEATRMNYYGTTILHLSRLAPFSIENVPVGGNASALNANMDRWGPSWRMVVELGDETKAWGTYPGGQSGNPGSPYYLTMLQHWIDGEYYPLQFAQSPSDLTDNLLFTQTFSN